MQRRTFLKKASIASTPLLLGPSLWGQTPPSRQITLGFIGMGGQGMGRNLRGFQSSPLSRILAVCDCNRNRLSQAKKLVDEHHGNTDCAVYQDFREVLARSDIDAVVISTPDHWHVPMSLMALEAGKHVFCEKPSLTIAEGRELVQAVEKSGKVFQWGIEDRSMIKYWLLSGIARTGAIGEIENVYCDLPRKPVHYKHEPEIPVPDTLDWNLWLGPAPAVEYTQTVLHPQRWRQHDHYSGGSLTDWGAHLCDTAQVGIGMENSGPVEISGTAEELPEDCYVTAPYGYDIQYRYANGATIHVRNQGKNIRFEGTKGWVECTDWNGTLNASDRNLLRNKTLGEHPDFWPRPELEWPNFLKAIVDSGKTPTYHPEAGHRLASMLHLGHLAIKEGKTIQWNPEDETFVQDANTLQKNKIYHRTSRDWEKGI
ncbi:MAG: Gfo/Idh/MocA family protein [Coraliomargaritaceae bacterium]